MRAKDRGIGWKFTLGTWLLFWGINYLRRGNGVGKLMMCRYGDEGPYSPDNCYQGTASDNAIDYFNKKRGDAIEAAV